MLNKLKTAKNFLVFRGNNKSSISLSLKCFFSYIFYCIWKNEDFFILKYNGKYIKNFKERSIDWFQYIWDNICKFFLKIFNPNSKLLRNYMLLNSDIDIPYHVKVTNGPNEALLSYYLKQNNFEIVGEYLTSVTTSYTVALCS